MAHQRCVSMSLLFMANSLFTKKVSSFLFLFAGSTITLNETGIAVSEIILRSLVFHYASENTGVVRTVMAANSHKQTELIVIKSLFSEPKQHCLGLLFSSELIPARRWQCISRKENNIKLTFCVWVAAFFIIFVSQINAKWIKINRTKTLFLFDLNYGDNPWPRTGYGYTTWW